eukprot:TRINITY_DN11702_c0_g1_i1.p1 TRINITY_DN11702_c0_g1~~TRINITY_DN11702_c0_g1_i1.p1  ORF type:complete len:434 (+),score=27.54 TRINITY_DN11702_c0_g1_i1:483-1784(+)
MHAVLKEGERIYVVQEGGQFIHPTLTLGEDRELAVTGLNGAPIMLTALSQSPRLFVLRNLVSESEIALLQTEAAPHLKRSSVGLSPAQKQGIRAESAPQKAGSLDWGRTSENAWLRTTQTSKDIKLRSFRVLGTETKAGEYDDRFSDGLQVLRYRPGQLYNRHLDYIRGNSTFNLNPTEGGSNRYATLFVYMSTPKLGGQTFFPKAHRSHEPFAHDLLQPRPKLNGSEISSALDQSPPPLNNSTWQRRLAESCFEPSGLSVYPKQGDAVLFYSQHADGSVDHTSEHAGCPVLEGEKWAVNLWVWNRPKIGEDQGDLPSTPMKLRFYTDDPSIVCRIYWKPHNGEKKLTDRFGRGYREDCTTNTFHSHRFELYVEGLRTKPEAGFLGNTNAGFVGVVVANTTEGATQEWKCSIDGVERTDKSATVATTGDHTEL